MMYKKYFPVFIDRSWNISPTKDVHLMHNLGHYIFFSKSCKEIPQNLNLICRSIQEKLKMWPFKHSVAQKVTTVNISSLMCVFYYLPSFILLDAEHIIESNISYCFNLLENSTGEGFFKNHQQKQRKMHVVENVK